MLGRPETYEHYTLPSVSFSALFSLSLSVKPTSWARLTGTFLLPLEGSAMGIKTCVEKLVQAVHLSMGAYTSSAQEDEAGGLP